MMRQISEEEFNRRKVGRQPGLAERIGFEHRPDTYTAVDLGTSFPSEQEATRALELAFKVEQL